VFPVVDAKERSRISSRALLSESTGVGLGMVYGFTSRIAIQPTH
jgi:hypothetical protein